jgi:type I protein arginine methyltransferase
MYEPQQPWLPSSEGIMDWGEDFHDLMLGDRLRMNAFRTAIDETVRKDAVVVDLGTGTGILAEWALRAGAARVYGIDFNRSMLDIAAARLAGFGDRFVAVPGLSFDLELPERADVIVSETLGNLVDNESCVRILADARGKVPRRRRGHDPVPGRELPGPWPRRGDTVVGRFDHESGVGTVGTRVWGDHDTEGASP